MELFTNKGLMKNSILQNEKYLRSRKISILAFVRFKKSQSKTPKKPQFFTALFCILIG